MVLSSTKLISCSFAVSSYWNCASENRYSAATTFVAQHSSLSPMMSYYNPLVGSETLTLSHRPNHSGPRLGRHAGAAVCKAMRNDTACASHRTPLGYLSFSRDFLVGIMNSAESTTTDRSSQSSAAKANTVQKGPTNHNITAADPPKSYCCQ